MTKGRSSRFVYLPSEGDAIASSENLDLLCFRLEPDSYENWEEVKDKLRRIDFLCEYTSIYGEKQQICIDALGGRLAKGIGARGEPARSMRANSV